MIFETHAHYDDDAFNEDRDAVIGGLQAAGIARAVNIGADMASSRRSAELSRKYDFIYAAVGVHPDNAGELVKYDGPVNDEDGTERMTDDPEENFAELRKMASMEKVISIGEIGLDYHWNVYPREVQKEAFIKQWELAIELGLPIEIHSRDAAEDTMNIVREMYAREQKAGRELRADMHCYSYSPEQAAEYARMGLYFGIGGVLTFKNAKKLREVVDLVPVEKLLLETDCPYLAPEPHRGQRNNSAYLHSVVAEIARIKGLTGAEVEDITYANACRFFNLQV
ncbi:MAG: TatD family hydrolase [Lachnospiraceae bacterium]|nr:TatD family hydrolase [Lachnospiraceae bacterium]